MFKKVGMVTVGVTAGLLVAAPFASAGESPDPGHHGGHGSHGHGGSDCNVKGGDATANGGIGGDAVAGALAQAPVGGLNTGNIVCNDILNDNISGNHLSLSVLSPDEDEATAPETTAPAGAGDLGDQTVAL
ncbi:hypothetical protein ACR9E3_06005 [Actinomycetospora sp. C-140]